LLAAGGAILAARRAAYPAAGSPIQAAALACGGRRYSAAPLPARYFLIFLYAFVWLVSSILAIS
jgi:hypothetical protein